MLRGMMFTAPIAARSEIDYQQDLGPEKIRTMRVAAGLGIILYSSFGILDIWAIPSSLSRVWAIRAAVVVVLALVFLSTYHRLFVRRYTLIAAVMYLVLGTGIDAMIYLASPDELARTVYYTGLILVVFALYIWTYVHAAVSLAVGLAFVSSYLYIAIAVQRMATPEEWPILLANSFFFVSANVIGFIGSRMRNRFARENYRLRNALERKLEKTIEARRASELRYIRQLQDSEALKAAIIETAPVGLVTVDRHGRIVQFNPAAEHCFGRTERDAVGCLLSDILSRPIETGESPDGASGGSSRFCGFPLTPAETEGIRADGSAFPVEVVIVPARGGGTEVFTAFVTDLTQKREAEAEIRHQREILYQREKLAAMGSLLAGVAHELNNPLAVVVGRSQMLDEELEDAGQMLVSAASIRDAVSRIRHAADRCARIVKTFLAMARQRRPERRAVQINVVIRTAVEMLSYGLRSAGIEVALQLDPEVSPLAADEDQLHQVFMNLIVNAQQAMADRPGPRRLTIASRLVRSEGRLVAEVGDTGPGIAPEHRARVFEPYFTTKPQGQGTGVGLPVCLGIIESHGGLLNFECPASGGTVFRIVLPIDGTPDERGPAKPGSADEPAVSRLDRASDAAERVPRLRPSVLVVDDEPELAAILGDILQSAAAEVTVASNGRDALWRLRQKHFDLVLTDLRMQELGGPELVGLIEQDWPHLKERVIFLTGDALSADVLAFLQEKRRPVIEKPFDAVEVRRCVADCLGSTWVLSRAGPNR